MRLCWALIALAFLLLIASLFPATTDIHLWGPLIAGSLFCSALGAVIALLSTVGIPTHRKGKSK